MQVDSDAAADALLDGSLPCGESAEILSHIRRCVGADQPRATYHAFTYRGERLLYDLSSGALASLSQGALVVLAHLQDPGGAGRPDLPLQELRELARELERLREAGFFRLEPLDSRETRDRVVNGLLDHASNKLMLLVHNACNLKCTYCYEVANGLHAGGKAMSWETAQRAVEALIERSRGRKQISITFFGGEPLLGFPLVRRVVAYCRGRGKELGVEFGFSLTTNGTLLTDEIVEFLVAERISVMLSFDGTPEGNDAHRVDHAGRGVGRRVLANGRKLVAAQKRAGLPPASVRVTMTEQNRDAGAIERFLAEQGFERVLLGASEGRADSKAPWDIHGEAAHGAMRASFDAKLQGIDERLRRGEPPDLGEGLVKALERVRQGLDAPALSAAIRCGVGRNMLAYGADGAIYPCHRYAGEEAYRLGDLEHGVRRERLESYYREVLSVYDKGCSGCWARFLCGGQCAWYLSRPDGHVGQPDEPSCDEIRGGLEKQLWLHLRLQRAQRAEDPTTEISR